MKKIVLPYRLGIICASLLVSLVLHQLYVGLASPQVPYMDTMMFFVQIDQILKGEISWLDIYGSGEHRGLLYPFITFVEWKLWDVDARISTALTGIVVAATFYYWLSAFLNAQVSHGVQIKKEIMAAFIFCIIAAVIIVSPAGFELWTLDLGFAQLFKNLLIIQFLYLLSVNRCWEKNLINAFALGIYGGFLIIFAAYGWSYPFLIACLFAVVCTAFDSSELRKQAVVVIVLLLLAQMIYVYSGHGVFSNGKSVGVGISFTGLIGGVLYGAGTAFAGSEAIEKLSVPLAIPLILGAATLIVALLAILITLLERTKEKIFLSSLMVFALTVLVGVAVARGVPDFTNTGASRYFVDYVWILLTSLAIIFATKWSTTSPRAPFQAISVISLCKLLLLAKLLALLLLIAALIGHTITWITELKTVPYRAVVFKNMAEVYRKGVISEADAALLQSPFSVARQAIVVAQSYKLSVLRNHDFHCTLKNAEYKRDWYAPEANDTRWMGKQGLIVLGNCAKTITLKGYIPAHFKQRNLRISYGNNNDAIIVKPGEEFLFRLNKMEVRSVVVTLEVDHTTSPLQEGTSADQRELGILLTYIGE